MADPRTTEFEAAFAAGVASADAKYQMAEFIVVPDGYKVESLEDFGAMPRRIRAAHRFVSVASLATYLDRFATSETLILADYGKASIKAILDGDAPDAPSHKSHSAEFVAVLDDRVKAWLALDGKPLTQTAFALFLEDRAVDVVEPSASAVMDMVIGFEATKKVAFQSSVRLSNGSRQLVYKEDNEQKGALTLPDRLVILAPIYRGMEPQRITFMVRYRIEDSQLRFHVQMHDKDTVLREAFERCVDALSNGIATKLPVYVVG